METKSTTAFSAAVPVPELLDKHNYAEWKIRVRTYLKGQDLWKDIIDDDQDDNGYAPVATNGWRRRNYMALHVIQISCGPQAFSKIKDLSVATDAWQTLKEKYLLHKGSIDKRFLQYADLYRAVLHGKLNAAKEFLDSQPEAVRMAITDKGETALHIAVTAGHADIVQELVGRMSEEDLGIRDVDGYTALMKALLYGRSKLARCLYPLSSLNDDLVLAEGGRKGAMLLTRAIYTRNLDLALDLIQRHPRLTYALDDRGESPFLALASMPHAFSSGNRLVFWKQWIYDHCIRIDQSTPSTSFEIRLNIPNFENGRQRNQVVTIESVPAVLFRHLVSVTVRKYLLVPAVRLRDLVSSLLGIKQLYEMKKINIQSEKLLSSMCEEISRSDAQQLTSGRVYDAINRAVKNGISEFVSTTVMKDSRVLENQDRNLRNIFMLIVLYRQSHIFDRLIISGKTGMKDTLTSYGDRNDDNMLHMAGIIEDSTRLNRSSSPALQMQRELQWFKEVERTINDLNIKEGINRDGLTPRQLFTKNHENMMEKGEKWMKDTASSCTVVGALIVTIMFAVAFTVPGGYNQTTGYPIFLKKKLFMLFIISDALSLFSSSTSVLMFLAILTSSYSEDDFLEYLPRQMIIGLLTLFCSIATMMITFSSALLIILHEQLQIAIPLICLACIPVTFFVWIQFPILRDMIKSTYISGIFNRNM